MPQIFMHRINDRRQIQISRQQLEGSGRVFFFFKGRGPVTEGASGYPFPDSRDRHQQPSSEFETTKATVSKYSFLLIYCLYCSRRQLTCVNLVTVFLFLECRVMSSSERRLIYLFLIYTHVKGLRGVRLG
jgi:hypothetical protein